MTKTAYFMDLELDTGGISFRPRFETEILVEKALELGRDIQRTDTVLNILDIGTGCGNIAISLTKHVSLSRIVALDISADALRVAMANASRYGVFERINFIQSNLFESIRGKYENFFDMIISNPPYVSRSDFTLLDSAVKDDPYIALYGGRDGLDYYRKIVSEAGRYLKIGGVLLMEIGYDQARAVESILRSGGRYRDVRRYRDYAGINRIISGKNG